MADTPEQQGKEREICGLIMPISGSDGYPEQHWRDVRAILEEVIDLAGFKPNMVSDADDVGIIHNRIVTNIYNNPIVVCDVSSKNPNVMFELGLRLAFDKATIIVKDDITTYNFDTSPIEHLGYPKNLNYHSINTFKKLLKAKIEATYKASKEQGYSTFLKNFVQYKRKLDEKEVGSEELILKRIEQMSYQLNQLQSSSFGDDKDVRPIDFYSLETAFTIYINSSMNSSKKPYTRQQIYNEFLDYLKKIYPFPINKESKPFIRHLVDSYFDKQVSEGNFDFINNSPQSKRNLLDALREKYGDRYSIDENLKL